MELVSEAKKAKVHSLIDKVYHSTNLRLAWDKDRENRGAGGVDQINIDAFQANAEVEIGAKLAISIVDGLAYLEKLG